MAHPILLKRIPEGIYHLWRIITVTRDKIYANHKIGTNRLQTFKCSLEGCVFALLAALSFLLMCVFSFFENATTTNTVNYNEWFEPLEVSKYCKYSSKVVNPNVSNILVWVWCRRCTHIQCNQYLWKQRYSEYDWIRAQSLISILLIHLYSKFHECLWATKKRFITDLWCKHR